MDVGKLNKRIEIQRLKKTTDNNHVTKTDFDYHCKCWANINNLYGKEKWDAKQYNLENSLTITIRYNSCPDITVKDRIKWNDRLFNIISVDNINYKNESLKISVQEVTR
ncbi:MAG TPA: head-tail adaptor protein [Flavobacteriaceae bacterium]|nr:head-tail adaptor protein [Flavobacteriaceae bacterium]